MGVGGWEWGVGVILMLNLKVSKEVRSEAGLGKNRKINKRPPVVY